MNAVADGNNGTYVILQEQEYNMESMAPGQAAMYMIHVLTTSGRDKVSGLSRAPEALNVKTVGGTPGHVYCSRAIQLMFAAGRHIGTLTDNEEAKGRSAPNSAPRKLGGKRRRDLSPEDQAPRDEGILQPRVRERNLSPFASLSNKSVSSPSERDKVLPKLISHESKPSQVPRDKEVVVIEDDAPVVVNVDENSPHEAPAEVPARVV